MRHDRFGYWLAEAGSVEPTRPLAGDTRADVVVVGGGYAGLWSAWHLLGLEPELDIVLLEAELCGHGPSGRNGGFVSTLWGELPTLRGRVGDPAALAVGRASAEAVAGIGAWCEEQDVDAWFRAAPHLKVASSAAQDGAWERVVRACAEAGVPLECRALDAKAVREVCASPLFRAGAAYPSGATVQPARLALGLRRRLLARGVRIFERSPVLRLTRDGSRATAFPGFGRALAVASSHIVLTEPVPYVLEQLGWTRGEAISDYRTLLHYFRTTPDGRIAFGWGGGPMGLAGRPSRRLEVDRAVVEQTRASLVRFFPQLRGRAITHAWGGPIDVSPTHLPILGSRGRVHHVFGFTGNGVGPSYLAGEILARLALDRRDDRTRLAIVEPDPKRFPPEPLRYAGGTLIRRALLRKDAAEDAGRSPDPVTRLLAGLPRRLGLHLPR